jgi:hypothetical protein
MTADVAWMFEGILLLDADAYQASPFPWAGSLQSIKWKGDTDQRTLALTAAKGAFSDLPWLSSATEWASAAAWPDAASVAYVKLLKTFYSFDAIRVLAGAYGLDGTGEIPLVITRCLENRIPLSSPDYLASYANRVKKVSHPRRVAARPRRVATRPRRVATRPRRVAHAHDALPHAHDALPHAHDALTHAHGALPYAHGALPCAHDALPHA